MTLKELIDRELRSQRRGSWQDPDVVVLISIIARLLEVLHDRGAIDGFDLAYVVQEEEEFS